MRRASLLMIIKMSFLFFSSATTITVYSDEVEEDDTGKTRKEEKERHLIHSQVELVKQFNYDATKNKNQAMCITYYLPGHLTST